MGIGFKVAYVLKADLIVCFSQGDGLAGARFFEPGGPATGVRRQPQDPLVESDYSANN